MHGNSSVSKLTHLPCSSGQSSTTTASPVRYCSYAHHRARYSYDQRGRLASVA
jgi:hypothetical protein